MEVPGAAAEERRSKKEVAEEVVEKAVKAAVQEVTEGDGIDQVEVQTIIVKEAESSPRNKSEFERRVPPAAVEHAPATAIEETVVILGR